MIVLGSARSFAEYDCDLGGCAARWVEAWWDGWFWRWLVGCNVRLVTICPSQDVSSLILCMKWKSTSPCSWSLQVTPNCGKGGTVDVLEIQAVFQKDLGRL